jgi:Holliday junction DNA helicase RuvA
MSGDSRTIARAPGVGRKTAERITLELRDKIKLTEDDMLAGGSSVSADDLEGDASSARDEAVAALVALGYNSTDAMKAVRKVIKADEAAANDTEALLKLALKEMF